jgi:3-hydroxyisobutyrate dehydrogenase
MVKNQTIGFIGIGVMGNSMAGHIMAAGFPLHIYTRTKEKAAELIEKGAVWEGSVAALAENVDVLITIIGTPNDVEEVYLGDDGILNHARAGSYVIDMTTSSPTLAVNIAEVAEKKGIHALDAPVSGGDVGAKNAKLAIMVGGNEADFNAVLPIFETMGENIVLQGEAGAGQHTKMVNQIAIAPGMIGVCEALLYTKESGLDPTTVLSSISTGAAGSWSLSNYGPRIIAGDFAPGFAIKHYIKDMKIALASAEEMGLDTPGLKLALDMYEQVAAKGELENGTHALMKFYRENGL